FVAGGGSRFALPEPAALDGDEARAEALQAGVVLVARRLVDDALPAELRLERLDREAVRLDAAVAAALAHRLVDDGADRRVRVCVALAAAALFRGAGLVVDQRRDAGHLAQLSLHPVELVAVADRHARGPIGSRRVFLRLVGDDDDRLHAFRGELARDDRRVERAVVTLSAGHRHRVVVEDLVGHGDLRRHGGADRQQPGMEVRAVAEIGEDVLLVGEGRLADPRRAFGPHVREGRRAAVHPDRHEVAADARRRAAAFRNARRGVVRAARAEIGLAYRRDARLRQQLFLEIEKCQPFPKLRTEIFCQPQLLHALRDHARDQRRRMLVVRRQQPGAGRLAAAAAPLAAVVELADHARRAHAFLPVVELFLELVLDELALFLDHQDLFEPVGEAPRGLRLERPRHADLVDAQADVARDALVDAQVGETLHHVAKGFAGSDDPKLCLGGIKNYAIELVGPGVSQRGVDLPVEDARFLLEDAVWPADVEPVGGKCEVNRNSDVYPVRVYDY